jgi:Asp-tRNA(Asn)/Glu-tRNA(Gln) amidotransferase A subunit family amidase
MTRSIPLNYLTASDAASLVHSGDISIVDLVQAHIERYTQRNADVEAWAFLDEDRALREAARLDAVPVEERGPLHGVVLGVKDMIRTCRVMVESLTPERS